MNLGACESITQVLDVLREHEREQMRALAARFNALSPAAQQRSALYTAGYLSGHLATGADPSGLDAFRVGVVFAEGLVERGEVEP